MGKTQMVFDIFKKSPKFYLSWNVISIHKIIMTGCLLILEASE